MNKDKLNLIFVFIIQILLGIILYLNFSLFTNLNNEEPLTFFRIFIFICPVLIISLTMGSLKIIKESKQDNSSVKILIDFQTLFFLVFQIVVSLVIGYFLIDYIKNGGIIFLF